MGGTNSTEKEANEAQLNVEKAHIHSMSPTSALLHKKQQQNNAKGGKQQRGGDTDGATIQSLNVRQSQDLKAALANASGLQNNSSSPTKSGNKGSNERSNNQPLVSHQNNNNNAVVIDAKAMKENIQSFVSCLRGPPRIPITLNIDPSLAGLSNYGNTCYANSVMQMLFHTPTFRHHILERYAQQITDLNAVINHDKNTDDQINCAKKMLSEWKETIWYELASLYSKITLASDKARKEAQSKNSSSGAEEDGDGATGGSSGFVKCPIGNNTNGLTYNYRFPVVEPQEMLRRVRKTFIMFDNAEQHDAHEFALTILNTLFEEETKFINRNPKNGETVYLNNNGAGSPTSSSTSPAAAFGPSSPSGASNASSSSSSLQQAINSGSLNTTLLNMTGKTVTLTSCIECDTTTSVNEKLIDVSCVLESKSSLRHIAEAFTSHEVLTGENKFRCDCCGSSCVARRRTLVAAPAPNLLLLQIKRFRYTQHGMTKLNDFVPFSDRLRVPIYDSKNNIIGSQLYRLCAFVVHLGSYPMAGHYFCIAYHRTTKQWLCLNDTKASVISERERMKYMGTCGDLFNSDQGNNVNAYVLSYEKDDEFDERQQEEEDERKRYLLAQQQAQQQNRQMQQQQQQQQQKIGTSSSGKKANRYDEVIV